MSDFIIPSDLVCLIFSLLPAEVLVRLRSVCKVWCRLIDDDPYFIKAHTERIRRESSSNNDFIHFLHINQENHQLCSLSLNLINSRETKFENLSIIPRTILDTRSRFISCDGLILIYNLHKSDCWSIINPLTREFHKLEIPSLPPYYVDVDEDEDEDETNLPNIVLFYMSLGFGYDCVTDDYKVVKHSLAYYQPNDINIKFIRESSVYSMKSKRWKNIDPCVIIFDETDGVFCNGALHWMGRKRPIRNGKWVTVIVAFDLSTEDIRYYSIPLPSIVPIDENCYFSHLHDLTMLDGCLSVRHYYCNQRFEDWITSEIWLMNDYGDEKSWSMLFSYSNSKEHPMKSLSAISYVKKKELVLVHIDQKSVFLIDLKDNTRKTDDLGISNTLQIYDPHVFVPSFVRINGANEEMEHMMQM